MKKVFLVIIQIYFGILIVNAQDGSEVKLNEIKVPVSPAFNILDFSPKTIENPGSIKAFTANIFTLAGQSGGIPQNFAFEFAPYWFFKNPNMNIYKYYGLNYKDTVNFKPNIFYGLRSTALSLASVFKDSSDALSVDVNYIGYALRSNIINIRNKKVLTKLNESIGKVNESLSNVHAEALNRCPSDTSLTCIGNFIANSKDSTFTASRKEFIHYLSARPIFNVDIALAGSTGFGNNKFSSSKRYRTGGWITMAYYQPLVSGKKVAENINNLIECKNYINAFFLFRLLNENYTADFKNFTSSQLLDFGGRIELEFNKFSVSVESIKRINNDDKNMNTSRTVGIFQYEVNENLFLLGTFGKDFGEKNNLISLLGINWGFGKKALNAPFKAN